MDGENKESAEVYGIDAETGYDDLLAPLLSQSIRMLFYAEPNIQNVMFMIEEANDNNTELIAAKQTGFVLRGKYRLYQKTL